VQLPGSRGFGLAFAWLSPDAEIAQRAINSPASFPRATNLGNDVDHPHPRRINQHHAILCHRVFDAFGFRRARQGIIGQEVQFSGRRHLRTDGHRDIPRSSDLGFGRPDKAASRDADRGAVAKLSAKPA
jgi:hypothetical protein